MSKLDYLSNLLAAHGVNAPSVAMAEIADHIALWQCSWSVHKYADPTSDIGDALKAGASLDGYASFLLDEPIERIENLLMYGGASCLWQCLIGNGTSSAGQALTYFSNAQAAIGTGDSSTAAAATQTDLQAVTNKLRVAMDSTYPQNTDATSSGAASIVFRSTFSTVQGNYAWQEWIVANSATAATGRALNRKVESLGTKTSAATWTFTVTLSLA